MNTNKTLEKIIGKDPEIQRALEGNPKLYDSLRGVYQQESDKYQLPIKAFELVDKYDKYLAIAETALRVPGPGPNMIGYAALRGTELLAKGITSVYYAGKTGDWGGIGKLVGMEAAETLAPFGEIGNVLPAYNMTAHEMLRKKVADRFKSDYLAKPKDTIIEFPRQKPIRKAA